MDFAELENLKAAASPRINGRRLVTPRRLRKLSACMLYFPTASGFGTVNFERLPTEQYSKPWLFDIVDYTNTSLGDYNKKPI